MPVIAQAVLANANKHFLNVSNTTTKILACTAISTAKPLLMLYGGVVDARRVVKMCFYYCDQLSGQTAKDGDMHKARQHAI